MDNAVNIFDDTTHAMFGNEPSFRDDRTLDFQFYDLYNDNYSSYGEEGRAVSDQEYVNGRWFSYVWNESDSLSNDTGNGYTSVAYNYWSLVLLVFPVLTVFGNVLVVLSVYRERSLQTVTNYFIVSLAIADIMVAILVMPLAVYTQV